MIWWCLFLIWLLISYISIVYVIWYEHGDNFLYNFFIEIPKSIWNDIKGERFKTAIKMLSAFLLLLILGAVTAIIVYGIIQSDEFVPHKYKNDPHYKRKKKIKKVL